jgi:hypothetical protein
MRVSLRGGRKGRGFHNYGPPMRLRHGGVAEVFESSLATDRCCWLKLEDALPIATGTACLQLTKREAERLIARLQTWIDEIPKRWR